MSDLQSYTCLTGTLHRYKVRRVYIHGSLNAGFGMDAKLNWTSLCVTRHLNRAAQMKTASIFNVQTTIYICALPPAFSLVSSDTGPVCNQLVSQLYISPPKNKKYCTTMCWCVTRWLAWQKNVSEEETWAKTGRSYSQARIWPTCPKTPAPTILLVEIYFAEKVDTCSGFCT